MKCGGEGSGTAALRGKEALRVSLTRHQRAHVYTEAGSDQRAPSLADRLKWAGSSEGAKTRNTEVLVWAEARALMARGESGWVPKLMPPLPALLLWAL